MATRRVRLLIRGKVQGVFFRQSLKVASKKNGVCGWVRNLEDGRVEAALEGEDVDVNRVIEWSHAGPANARVTDVEIITEKFTGEPSKFDVLY